MPIFRICVFSPFLKQQKLGGRGEVWSLPADPARQAEQLVRFSVPHVGWLPLSSQSRGAQTKTHREGGKPQNCEEDDSDRELQGFPSHQSK